MGPPDMKLPIQYALTYPHRVPGVADKVNWSQAFSLDLFPPNEIQSAALELGFLVCERGGTSGAVFNAANEVAVAAFLDNRLPFHLIVPYCRDVLEQHQIVNSPTYDELCLADRWAREEMNKCILT
jgi:1-deoxy-D-xylulose-5-phosphate reductoisomerase